MDEVPPSDERRHLLLSDWMRKRRTLANDKSTFHSLCWMAHIA